MKRFLSPIFIGILLTVVFLVLQAFLGGVCHCSRPLQYFFPYVSMLGVHADWGVLGFLLFALQFPVYAVCVALARGPNWKARVLLILFAVHACAVWIAFKISR
jgi:hypothetical protein